MMDASKLTCLTWYVLLLSACLYSRDNKGWQNVTLKESYDFFHKHAYFLSCWGSDEMLDVTLSLVHHSQHILDIKTQTGLPLSKGWKENAFKQLKSSLISTLVLVSLKKKQSLKTTCGFMRRLCQTFSWLGAMTFWNVCQLPVMTRPDQEPSIFHLEQRKRVMCYIL